MKESKESNKEKEWAKLENFNEDDDLKMYEYMGSKVLQKCVRLIALNDVAASLILMTGSLYFCATADSEMTVIKKGRPVARTSYNYNNDDDSWFLPEIEISGTQMIIGAVIASQMTQMIFALCLLSGANYRMRDNCEPWIGLQCLILIITLLILIFVGGLLAEEMPIIMIVLILSCLYKAGCILIVGKFVGQLEKSGVESKKLLDGDDEEGTNEFVI